MRRCRCLWYLTLLDLRIAHDRFGSSSCPNLNGHLHFPNDIDRSINEAATDKIRKYRSEYNNNPPNTISFMFVISSTSGRLHGEFVRLLFLQAHRETDRFFAASRVQLAHSTSGQFRRLLRLQLYELILTLMGRLSLQEHILTHHTRKLLVY